MERYLRREHYVVYAVDKTSLDSLADYFFLESLRPEILPDEAAACANVREVLCNKTCRQHRSRLVERLNQLEVQAESMKIKLVYREALEFLQKGAS